MTNNFLTAIRIILILFLITVNTFSSSAGNLSIAASILLLLSIILDKNSRISSNQVNGEDLDTIGFNLGTERRTYSVMGMKIKETDNQYRQRMRKVLMGISGREEG
jgi:4-alpha-glucanotransferase